MGSTLEFDVSSHHSPSLDLVPPIQLIKSTYTMGWVPTNKVQRHAGVALLHKMFEMPQQRPMVVFVPIEAY